MEKILSDTLSRSTVEEFEQLDDETLKDVEAELKKLGYV